MEEKLKDKWKTNEKDVINKNKENKMWGKWEQIKYKSDMCEKIAK